jgi:hypothetical protein
VVAASASSSRKRACQRSSAGSRSRARPLLAAAAEAASTSRRSQALRVVPSGGSRSQPAASTSSSASGGISPSGRSSRISCAGSGTWVGHSRGHHQTDTKRGTGTRFRRENQVRTFSTCLQVPSSFSAKSPQVQEARSRPMPRKTMTSSAPPRRETAKVGGPLHGRRRTLARSRRAAPRRSRTRGPSQGDPVVATEHVLVGTLQA